MDRRHENYSLASIAIVHAVALAVCLSCGLMVAALVIRSTAPDCQPCPCVDGAVAPWPAPRSPRSPRPTGDIGADAGPVQQLQQPPDINYQAQSELKQGCFRRARVGVRRCSPAPQAISGYNVTRVSSPVYTSPATACCPAPTTAPRVVTVRPASRPAARPASGPSTVPPRSPAPPQPPTLEPPPVPKAPPCLDGNCPIIVPAAPAVRPRLRTVPWVETITPSADDIRPLSDMLPLPKPPEERDEVEVQIEPPAGQTLIMQAPAPQAPAPQAVETPSDTSTLIAESSLKSQGPEKQPYQLALFLASDPKSAALKTWFESDPVLQELRASVEYQEFTHDNALYQSRYADIVPADQFPVILFLDSDGGHIYAAGGAFIPSSAKALLEDLGTGLHLHEQAKQAGATGLVRQSPYTWDKRVLPTMSIEQDCPGGNCPVPPSNTQDRRRPVRDLLDSAARSGAEPMADAIKEVGTALAIGLVIAVAAAAAILKAKQT